MRIKSITLHNFKCFEGTHSISDLSNGSLPQKNVILVGGLNGAGKTTLLEAIILCLYGIDTKNILWPSKGAPKEDYQNYIKSITNNRIKSQELKPDMWVELVLDEVEIGSISHRLTIRRTWIIDTQKNVVEDDLEISERGKPFELASKESWHAFIKDIIPYEISQFFFFDGEKIQDFVRDEDKEFASSLEKVLGISLYETLRSDLETVRSRILNEYNRDEDIKVKISEIQTKIAECEKDIRHKEESIDQLHKDIISIDEQIDEINIQTRRITRVEADTLDEFESEKSKLVVEKKFIEEKIFETVQDDLPFVFTANLLNHLETQLSNELNLVEFQSAQKALEPQINLIIKKLFDEEVSSPPLLPQQQEFYKKKLKAVLNEVLSKKSGELENVPIIHDLSKSEIELIRFKAKNIKEVVRELRNYLIKFQEIDIKLREISKTEKKTGDPEAARLYEEKGKLIEKKRSKEDEIINVSAQIKRQEDEIDSYRRELNRLEDRVKRTMKMEKQIDYCRKLRSVLEDFSNRLREQKVEQLQALTLEMWSLLSRKDDHIKRIIVNPNRQFTIDLYDADDRLLDKTKLSAGEKEILAISLIWALSRLAERDLPVVIDTPLGRLDTIHRTNIARNYFPNAGRQVILLSTNTEVVGEEYNAIKSALNKCFILKKDKQQESSQILEGYFN